VEWGDHNAFVSLHLCESVNTVGWLIGWLVG
jgi:hypothetical protein